MGKGNLSDEFKRTAEVQTTERDYPVAEVSEHIGARQHLLYQWTKKFGSGRHRSLRECRGGAFRAASHVTLHVSTTAPQATRLDGCPKPLPHRSSRRHIATA